MNNIEHTTMYAIARMLYNFDHPFVDLTSPYYWDNAADSVRHKYFQRAVKIIYEAEPVWRDRVEADPGAEAGWTAAVDHLEATIGQEMKRAAHADNPYRKADNA